MILCLRKVLGHFFSLYLVDTCSTLEIIPLSTSKYLLPGKCICQNSTQAKIRCNFNPPWPAVRFSTAASPTFHKLQKAKRSRAVWCIATNHERMKDHERIAILILYYSISIHKLQESMYINISVPPRAHFVLAVMVLFASLESVEVAFKFKNHVIQTIFCYDDIIWLIINTLYTVSIFELRIIWIELFKPWIDYESHCDLKNLNRIKLNCETPKDSHLGLWTGFTRT